MDVESGNPIRVQCPKCGDVRPLAYYRANARPLGLEEKPDGTVAVERRGRRWTARAAEGEAVL